MKARAAAVIQGIGPEGSGDYIRYCCMRREPMQISEVFYAPKDTWLGTASLYPEKPAVTAVSEISIRY